MHALAWSIKHTSAENVHLKSVLAFALTNAEAALCIQDAPPLAPSHLESSPLARTSPQQQACPSRAFITSTWRPNNSSLLSATQSTLPDRLDYPYTGHSNNKDAGINPSALKNRKLSEAISAWIEVMQREHSWRMKETRREDGATVETEGKCQRQNKNSQQINANDKHTRKLKRRDLNAVCSPNKRTFSLLRICLQWRRINKRPQ